MESVAGSEPRAGKRAGAAAAFAAFALGGAMAAALFVPPPADQRSAFSADAAMAHVAALAAEPHPAGSPAQERARAYILARLRSFGLEPEQRVHGAYTNILATIPGSSPERTLLVLSHYDSTPRGPGAADNATGVAALLEVARCLSGRKERLPFDVRLLFDDGEEEGYRGSIAYLLSDPSVAEGLDAVVSLDTAALSPVAVLRVGAGGDFLVDAAAASGGPWFADSFFAFLTALSGDDSDYTPFERMGVPGIALEDPLGFKEKHGPLDVPALVDPRRVAQMGNQVLGLAEGLASRPEPFGPSARKGYLTVPGAGPVAWPAAAGSLAAVLGGAVMAGVAAFSLRGGGAGAKLVRAAASSGKGLLAAVAAGAAGVAVSAAFGLLLPLIDPSLAAVEPHIRAGSWSTAGAFLGAAFAAAAGAAALAVGGKGAGGAYVLFALPAAAAAALDGAGAGVFGFCLLADAALAASAAAGRGRAAASVLGFVRVAAAAFLFAPALALGFAAAGVPSLPIMGVAAALACLGLGPALGALSSGRQPSRPAVGADGL